MVRYYMRYLFLVITLIISTLFSEPSNTRQEEPRPNENGPTPKRSTRSIHIKISEKEPEIIEIAKSLNVGTDSTVCLVEVKFMVNRAGIVYNSEIVSNSCNNTDIEQEITDWLRGLRFRGLEVEDTSNFIYPFHFGGQYYQP